MRGVVLNPAGRFVRFAGSAKPYRLSTALRQNLSMERLNPHPTRRRVLSVSAGAGAWLYFASKAFAAGEFWNRKAPSTWNTDEVIELTTNSPWAKDVRIDFKAKGKDAEGERGPDPGPSPFGMNKAEGGRTAGKAANVVITWESALPLYDALHYKIPADFINHYVIGIKDLPIVVDAGPERQSPEQLIDWLENSATLRAKSKEPVQCGVVATSREGSMVLFGFLRDLIPLTAKDKEVLFTLDTNQLVVKAEFRPKDMIYRGQLAL